MVKLIQKSGFIKLGDAAGYIKYIAAPDGVEKIGLEGSLECVAPRRRGWTQRRPVCSGEAPA